MRHVTLIGTGIRTSALGFGTSSLMGKLDKSESFRLLEAAYEKGIRYFDTAPLYGYGESESLLGAFLRTHRDVTVATKFGLSRPHAGSSLFSRAKQIARPILRAFPSLRSKAVNLQPRVIKRFDADVAAKSLAMSLTRLGRDYIDVFLLHDCRPSDLRDDGLLHFLGRARERGQIRAFGIGTDIETIKYCVASAHEYAGVIQFANNNLEPNLEHTPGMALERACITHSPFGGIGRTVLSSKSALAYASSHNPLGVVLFSSQNAGHIDANCRSFTECKL